jgi:SAM-dependent methyltransferase
MVSSSARTSSERPFYALHADAYDLLITDPVEPWVDAVDDRLSSASVLDAGCGTGRHAAALTAKGHRVDLVDASAELLSLAAKRCPSARTTVADLCAMKVPPAYDAVTCRGVLNDMITDQERGSAVSALARSLTPGGLLFLDVREQRASRERADGVARSRHVHLGDGAGLTFTARTTWSQGMLQVEEDYELVRPRRSTQRSSYSFTMRPWTEAELLTVLHDSGLHNVEISAGVGRRTTDRFFVVASSETAHRHRILRTENGGALFH